MISLKVEFIILKREPHEEPIICKAFVRPDTYPRVNRRDGSRCSLPSRYIIDGVHYCPSHAQSALLAKAIKIKEGGS
jgi:hypothetical protein